jgi:hypothetical protein
VLNEFNGEAVFDRETGLVWERSPSPDAFDWGLTRFQCLAKDIGGRRGWRLPSIHELHTLVDPAVTDPALPAGHPFLNVGPPTNNMFWSATTNSEIPTAAWFMNLFVGTPNDTLKSIAGRGWCVRGGGPLSEY